MQHKIELTADEVRAAIGYWLSSGAPDFRGPIRKGVDLRIRDGEDGSRYLRVNVPPEEGLGFYQDANVVNTLSEKASPGVMPKEHHDHLALVAEIRSRLTNLNPEVDLPGSPIWENGVTCVREIWIEVLGRDSRELRDQKQRRKVGKALRQLGYTAPRSTYTHPIYGNQKKFLAPA